MEILQAILLGIIEGFTEFLPISSTGHIIIAQEFIGFRDTARVFTVVIQSGAALAVVWYYRQDLWHKLTGFFRREKTALKFARNILVAITPAGLMGLMLNESFKSYATAKTVAIALIIGAIVLWLADKKAPSTTAKQKVELEKLTVRQSLIVGIVQTLALIPGVSRSGASIVGGLLGGMNRVSATAFSFYLSIPLLGLASVFKLIADREELPAISGGAVSILAGGIAAFIVALLTISWLLKYISTHSFRVFVYYRLALGFLVLAIISL